MKRIKRLILIITPILLIGGFIGVKFILPYAIIQPPKHSMTINMSDPEIEISEISVNTIDSIKLAGYLIKGPIHSGTTMILVHGIGGFKEHFVSLGKELARQGINAVVFDLRAHGKSEGEYCTYGFYEKNDISQIIDMILDENPNETIGIWGNSLGGAIAIQALELDKRLKFGVIESTFTSLRQIVYDYQKRAAKGIGVPFLCDLALQEAGKIANFDPNQVQPLNSATNIEQAVFVAHGDSDDNISVEYGKQLFENLNSKDKELYIVEEGEHFGLLETGGYEYGMAIFDFIQRQIQ